MNQVVEFTARSNVDRALIQQLFKKFHLVYGTLWKAQFDGLDLKEAIDYWLGEFQQFSHATFTKAIKHACDQYREYPPKIGQILDICWHYEGVPSLVELIQLAIRKDFTHPIVLEVYEKLGSWTLKNSKEAELMTLASPVYHQALHDFKANPLVGWNKIEQHKEKLLLESQIPPKIPSEKERRGFKEHYAEWKAKAAEEKAAREAEGGKPAHPVYEVGHVTIGHRSFDEAIYNERKRYLLGLKEHEAATLPSNDWYDRVKFLREIEAVEHLKRVGYTGNKPTSEVKDRDTGYQARKTYKNWFAE